jgi:hypothetical protein
LALQQPLFSPKLSRQPAWPVLQQTVFVQIWPAGQHTPPSSPQPARPTGQQVSPEHSRPAGQQVPPQQWEPAGQQLLPQVNDWLQQLSPAQPLAGGLHGVSPHRVTGAAQTPLKQLPPQQSPSCVQAPPFSLPQFPFGQQVVPGGQLSALH